MKKLLTILAVTFFLFNIVQSPAWGIKAKRINTATTNFNNNLSSADTDVQKALDTIDNFSLGGGSGSMTTVKEDGVQLGGADITTLDFLGADFDLTESPDKEINIIINDAGIDHNATTNFVLNKHIDHTLVIFTAGVGLSGGGDISSSKTFTLDLNELTTETTIDSGDFITMVDITDSGSGKITFANLEGTVSHDNIAGVSTSDHHTQVVSEVSKDIVAGVGLSGGEDNVLPGADADTTLTLDLNELGNETTIAPGDFIVIVDITDSGSQKITFANIESALDHGSIAGLTDDDHTQYQKETDFTEGSLLFRGASVISEDNANLFWDDINNSLGIGTNTGLDVVKLSVQATFSSPTVSTSAQEIQNTLIGGTGSVIHSGNKLAMTVDPDGGTIGTNWISAQEVQQILKASGTGTITNFRGFTSRVSAIATATNVTNLVSLYVQDVLTSTYTGTITNHYGLFIEGLKATGITNGWGVYQEGSDDINYFNGATGIGTNAPDTKLTVNGDANISDGFGLVIGHTTQVDFGAVPEFQILGTAVPDSSMGFAVFSSTASISPDFRFLKSRGVTIGSNVLVVDGDRLGRIRFQGADGGDFNTTAAELQVEVDGVASLNNVYGRFIWRTRSASGLNEKMRLTSLGLLGLGTSDPQKDFHISSVVPTIRLSDSDAVTDQAVATLIEFYRADNTNRVGFWGMASSSNDVMVLATDYADGELRFRTGSNVERMAIDKDGNIGVGTTAPRSLFNVHAAIGSQSVISLSDGDVAHGFTSVVDDEIYLNLTAIGVITGGALITGFSEVDQTAMIIRANIGSTNPTDTTPAMQFRAGKLSGTNIGALADAETAYQFSAYNGGIDWVTILGDGKVGIGTASPIAVLEVSGDGNLANVHTRLINFNNTNNNGVYLTVDRARGTQASPAAIQAQDEIFKIILRGRNPSGAFDEAASIYFEVDGTPGTGDMPGRIVFLTTLDGTSTPIERMRIDNVGNVGIRTPSPDSELHVIGGLCVEASDTGCNATIGTVTVGVGFDVVGAADMDYGSPDVLDHTFQTDGVGNSEIVLPTGSIGSGEILDETIVPSDVDETQDYSYTTLSGKQDRNNTAINDNDCTGEQGLWWYDTTDLRFEFCDDNSGVPAVLGGGSGAPTNATYVVISLDATLSDERVLTEGLALDFTDGGAGGNITIAFDPTELIGNTTWGDGTDSSIVWTWDLSSGDPVITFGNALITFSQNIEINALTVTQDSPSGATYILDRLSNNFGRESIFQFATNGVAKFMYGLVSSHGSSDAFMTMQDSDGNVMYEAEDVGTVGDFFITRDLLIGNSGNTTDITTTSMDFAGTAKPRRRVFIPAFAGRCRTTDGCDDTRGWFETGTNNINFNPSFFGDSTDQFWQTTWTIPENYDAGTFTASIEWTDDPDDPSTGGGVAWFVQMMSITDDDAIDTAFGTAIEINDDWLAGEDFHRTAESAAITASGSPAGGHRLFIQVYRDVDDADDDLSGAGMEDLGGFLGIWIAYTVDALSTED